MVTFPRQLLNVYKPSNMLWKMYKQVTKECKQGYLNTVDIVAKLVDYS